MTDQPSKSARKREFLALQALGEKLIDVSEQKLRRMPLDDELLEAIVAAANIKSRSALRRQRQLIGKLMGRADGDAIRAAYDALTRSSREDKTAFHHAEKWRDRIVNEGSTALRDFLLHCGREDPELETLAHDLYGSENDNDRKRLKRQVFRRVHDLLGSGMHSDAS